MSNKSFFIFVEGLDDERLIEKIFKPLCSNQWSYIKTIQYAGKKPIFVSNYIKSINSMPNSNYLFLTDIDECDSITNRKQKVCAKYNGLDENNVLIVIKEIEGWYLAGLNDICCRKMGIQNHLSTNHISKEDFDKLIPRKYSSRLDFMVEILKCFCHQTGKQKNDSFKYLLDSFVA